MGRAHRAPNRAGRKTAQTPSNVQTIAQRHEPGQTPSDVQTQKKRAGQGSASRPRSVLHRITSAPRLPLKCNHNATALHPPPPRRSRLPTDAAGLETLIEPPNRNGRKGRKGRKGRNPPKNQRNGHAAWYGKRSFPPQAKRSATVQSILATIHHH